ncbi:hypothetical protein EYZ11_002047 [Aspergillus tanneri]|uniref:Uncharacterized protein n=1 Tax=Aspergillus tanneri TaxID=1220188 RepID=A0A4S3JRU4_9EURO|nr:uncharacterized protein ATNIH1004_007301 [Aspergillus tanneri]KAA8645880.1 hypothetical protein ATNIH1004_007301 [Aspergillus tanneri]THC98462.1 hypothetical protein EYZ11_002047 [Aspergillus tanneri]
MTGNMQGSGGGCWPNSPPMDVGESPSLASFAYQPSKSLGLETESLRHQHLHGSVAESPCEWPLSPEQEMPAPADAPPVSPEFSQVDPNAWYPQYLGCVQHFLNQGQHSPEVQSLTAFINIRLPCQRLGDPVVSSSGTQPPAAAASQVCLRSYIRRLIVTGHDTAAVLRAFFGEEWQAGVGCVWRQERINYLFTAKAGGWASTKAAYDLLPDEQTPFLRPLHNATEEELRTAESRWSEWLAMEDWMMGPRSPW